MSARTSFLMARTRWSPAVRQVISSVVRRGFRRSGPINRRCKPAVEALEGRCLLSYAITDLGDYAAAGINNSGQVVGDYYTGTAFHAFLYDPTSIPPKQDLGTLGGRDSQALGINDSSQVVGFAFTTGDLGYHAFLYDGSMSPAMQDLGTLGGSQSVASGINASGLVVGQADPTDFPASHAFLYDPTANPPMQDLGTFGAARYSAAAAINGAGQVVGTASLPGDTSAHAFLYDAGAMPPMQDLGTLGGTYSGANGINAAGQVVGSSYLSGDATSHAFLYDPSATPPMQDLGILSTFGTRTFGAGINDLGQVVGYADSGNQTPEHALIYDGAASPAMQDLNSLIPSDSGWTLRVATAINDRGQIVGFGTINGQTHAFLLNPIVNEAPTISSAPGATFTAGTAGTFTVTTTGFPPPALGASGVFPGGVSFIDNGNGTATLAGTPAAGSGGIYHVVFLAANDAGFATEHFTLTVNEAPSITSAAGTTFFVGVAGSFTVTTTGFPVPALGVSGALPGGVTFTDNGDGTASLRGTPAEGTGGTYELVILAVNAVGATTQHFTLTVNAAPAPHGGTRWAALLDPTFLDSLALWLPVEVPVWAHRRTAGGLAADDPT
jgi:probable HAF family extracellular repeat protein